MKNTALLASVVLVAAAALASCRPRPATPPVAAVTAAPDPALARLGLFERLARERATRPAAHPRAEDLETALAKRGLPLDGWKQVLATPVGARFCMAGRTAAGLGVALCEYATTADAEAGQRRSHAAFDRLIPDRTLRVRGTALLTLTGRAADADAVAATFAAL